MLLRVRASQIRSPRVRAPSQGAAQVGQRLAVPAQDHREHVAPPHQAARPDLRVHGARPPRGPAPRSPVRVCPSSASALPSVARTSASRSGSPLRRASVARRPELAHGLGHPALVAQHDALRMACHGQHPRVDGYRGQVSRGPSPGRARRMASRSSSSASATSWLLGIGGPFPHHPVTTTVTSQLELSRKRVRP